MESIVHTSKQTNTNAEKTYLTWNGKLVLKSDFGQIPQTVDLYFDDIFLGIVEYPNSALGDKNKYLVLERDTYLLRVPLKHRPVRHDYRDETYWKKLVPSVWSSKEHHRGQYHIWNEIFKDNVFKQLFLATRYSAF